jgi:hypothetical protein
MNALISDFTVYHELHGCSVDWHFVKQEHWFKDYRIDWSPLLCLYPLSCAEFHLKTSMSGSFMLVSSSGCVN